MNTLEPRIQPTTEYARPFLKWAGGKSQLIAQISDHLPTVHDRIAETIVVDESR